MLRPGLDDPVVFPGGIDHLPAFPDVMADGLFDVNMLARLARHDRRQTMPVIGSGDNHRVNLLHIQKPAKVLVLCAAIAFDIHMSKIGITYRDHFDIIYVPESPDMPRTFSADTDDPDIDPVISPQHAARHKGINRTCRDRDLNEISSRNCLFFHNSSSFLLGLSLNAIRL